MSLSLLWWALILTYLPCEFGEQLSNGIVEIDDCIDQFNWYLFPLEIRQMLPIILISVQQPVEIRFFGSVACNRDSFKKVRLAMLKFIQGKEGTLEFKVSCLFQIINCTFSYFMVLREFTV